MSNQILYNILSIKTFRIFDILVNIAKKDNIYMTGIFCQSFYIILQNGFEFQAY